MNVICEMVESLSARLPELSWKLGLKYSVLNPKLLPRGLFKEQMEMTPQSCINEIKADLVRIGSIKNERSLSYMVDRVSQKIHVLVRLCQWAEEKNAYLPASPSFGMQVISTRQQWLAALREDIERLDAQCLALSHTLTLLKKGNDTKATLNLQSELGEVERRLTLARETLERATL